MHKHPTHSPLSPLSPIGIFDSGIGGLSVLKELQRVLPNENLIYLADSANAPYGDQSEDFIQQRALTIADFLSKQSVKAMVVACNTATAAAVNALRSEYQIPVVGLEPAIKPAVFNTKNGMVGVLATSQTLASKKYQQLKSQYENQATIIDVACQGLVEYIEDNKQDSAEFYQLLTRYIQPLQNQHIDTLVLGCTHYPFAKTVIQKIVSADIEIIDSGKAVAEQTGRQLKNNNLLNDEGKAGRVDFYSNQPDSETLSHLWGNKVRVQAIEI